MKFTVTKTWQELPFSTITIMSNNSAFRLEASATTPTGEGVPFRGYEIEKYSDNRLWIKLDSSETADSVEVTIGNFI